LLVGNLPGVIAFKKYEKFGDLVCSDCSAGGVDIISSFMAGFRDGDVMSARMESGRMPPGDGFFGDGVLGDKPSGDLGVIFCGLKKPRLTPMSTTVSGVERPEEDGAKSTKVGKRCLCACSCKASDSASSRFLSTTFCNLNSLVSLRRLDSQWTVLLRLESANVFDRDVSLAAVELMSILELDVEVWVEAVPTSDSSPLSIRTPFAHLPMDSASSSISAKWSSSELIEMRARSCVLPSDAAVCWACLET
jgi:hypothetical protein